MTNEKDLKKPATGVFELSEAALDDASGGLLLPAVQKVREAPAHASLPASAQLANGNFGSIAT